MLMPARSWWVHVLVPVLFGSVSLVGAVLQVYAFKVHDYDYGIYSNIIWNFANGNGFYSSIQAHVLEASFLEDHLSLIVPLPALVMRFFPSVYLLAVWHGLSFALCFLLLPALVRCLAREARVPNYNGVALFSLCALFVYKPFLGAWRFETHLTTLFMPLIFVTVLCLHHRKTAWALLCTLLLLLVQERAALAVCGLGMYAFLLCKQRLWLCVSMLSAVYFVVAVKCVIPSFRPEHAAYIYESFINPLYQLKQKALFVINMCLYAAFLPVAGQRACLALLCALPLVLPALVSARPAMYSFAHHYGNMTSLFVFIAAAHGGCGWCRVRFGRACRALCCCWV